MNKFLFKILFIISFFTFSKKMLAPSSQDLQAVPLVLHKDFIPTDQGGSQAVQRKPKKKGFHFFEGFAFEKTFLDFFADKCKLAFKEALKEAHESYPSTLHIVLLLSEVTMDRIKLLYFKKLKSSIGKGALEPNLFEDLACLFFRIQHSFKKRYPSDFISTEELIRIFIKNLEKLSFKEEYRKFLENKGLLLDKDLALSLGFLECDFESEESFKAAKKIVLLKVHPDKVAKTQEAQEEATEKTKKINTLSFLDFSTNPEFRELLDKNQKIVDISTLSFIAVASVALLYKSAKWAYEKITGKKSKKKLKKKLKKKVNSRFFNKTGLCKITKKKA